ncbi:MAG TPA: sterol desaturase family protein [Candidatus Limnocylindrales bacterium]|nr:sterol desaturase family protein [Candidatus Limnocylindrales bacterium]
MAKANYGDLPINHSEEPIRLFKSDYLEFFTHIHPVVVLLLYVPVVAFFLVRAFAERSGGSVAPIFGIYVVGLLVWSLSEYLLHRYLFHYEPTHPTLKWVWYLIHGVHHEQPQCKTRLVMPPILSIPLAFLFFGFFKIVVGGLLGAPLWVAPLFAGFVTGYISYDMLHYAEHHLSMKWGFLKFVKRYHLLHHFRTPEHRFGVSSPLWDYIFGTRPKGR